MDIQKILFPQVGRCTEEKLYYKSKSDIEFNAEENAIYIGKGDKVKFGTYFNGLSIEKWMKYTVVTNVSLRLKLKGKCRVTLVSLEKINSDVFRKVISENIVEASTAEDFSFSYENGDKKGMYTFEIKGLDKESILYEGAYFTEVNEDKIRDVKIGIAICTFKREPFIEKNIKILKENILENEKSPLYRHLEVFIADNGQSLDESKLVSENVRVNPNRNLGGAGGFTRDLIEIMKANKESNLGVTHALLMDDDIVIEPEALVKTYMVLSLLKEEYKDAFIGGAMLRLDKQNVQVEAGASWNGGALNSLKSNIDLTKTKNCLYNEFEEYTEFNAWWYCCFPMDVVNEENLPLPIFIRGDDLEYGLRNMKTLILMNGICVWHEAFENKYSSFLEYYIMRNQLIDNSFHCQWYGAKQLSRAIIGHCFREIMFYRYKNVELYLQGIKDFLKGPEWLMAQDGEALHKQVMAAGYKAVELNTLDVPFNYPVYEKTYSRVDKKVNKIKRLVTFNGLVFKAKGTNIVPMSAARPVSFYRMKKVLQYDATSKKGFVTEKSFGRSVKYIFKTVGMTMVVPFKIKKAQKLYRTTGLKLRTLEFWNEFLGLNQEAK